MKFTDYSIRGKYLSETVWWDGEAWNQNPETAKCYPTRKDARRQLDNDEIPDCVIDNVRVVAFDSVA